MEIKLRTPVPGNLEEVYSRFDRRLFLHLSPPGTKLIKFEGNETGDVVHIKLGFPVFKEWIGTIESHAQDSNFYQFVDVGVKTPLGIKTWKHIHLIEEIDGQVYIDDHISFSCKSWLWSIIAFTLIVPPMKVRKWGYRSYYKA